MELSQRLQRMASSATLAMSQKSTELKAQGVDVINLSVGEPDFFTPDFIKKGAQQAIADNFSFYSPVPGYMSLREAISAKLLKENNVEYKPSQIVCSNGAKQSVCNALMALIDRGDEVILPAPCWVSYVEMVKLSEGTPVVVEADHTQNFKISPSQLKAAITPKTKAILICSPSNPTGAVYTREELCALKDVLLDYPQIMILADEIYEHINYIGKHESLSQFEEIRDRLVVINGVSKSYAMTGYRLGWMAAPEWLAKACTKLQGQYTSGPSSIAQKAAETAYRGPQDCVEEMRQAFKRRRDLVCDLIETIPGLEMSTPDGAFYAFPTCKAFFGKKTPQGTVINDATDLSMYLLLEAHVASVSGIAFGSSECIRMSYATSDENLIEGYKRIKKALALLK